MTDNLYCPRCSKPFSSDTSYCRTCGLSLEGVSEIVSGEAASAPVMTSQPNFKTMRIGMGLFILGLVIGLLNGALRDFDLYPQAYGKMIFLLFIALGLLTIGSGFVFPTKKYTKRKLPRSITEFDSEQQVHTAPLKGQLDAAYASVNDIAFPKDGREFESVPVGSVTEQTTRNLGKQVD